MHMRGFNLASPHGWWLHLCPTLAQGLPSTHQKEEIYEACFLNEIELKLWCKSSCFLEARVCERKWWKSAAADWVRSQTGSRNSNISHCKSIYTAMHHKSLKRSSEDVLIFCQFGFKTTKRLQQKCLLLLFDLLVFSIYNLTTSTTTTVPRPINFNS
jgi:hypothetical protein